MVLFDIFDAGGEGSFQQHVGRHALQRHLAHHAQGAQAQAGQLEQAGTLRKSEHGVSKYRTNDKKRLGQAQAQARAG